MYNANGEEQEILKFWEKNKIFERSVNERPADKPYVFYDGPPFATGSPHYGHIVASTMKDAVPRYWTMRGRRVERVWGWDCHGLPIENIVEKELGTKSKKDIENMGVAKFNELCRSKVLGYVEEWKKTVRRLGRWVDMEHAYRTMDRDYMESVWWVFKELWDKKLVYQDYRSMFICPRCETTLSQQEVSEGYKDVKDISVYVKFKLKNAKEKLGVDGDVYMLAWTTTPWTLPGNVALAVGPSIRYVLVDFGTSKEYLKIDNEGHSSEKPGGLYIIAKERLKDVFKSDPVTVIMEMIGSKLADIEYEPLFEVFNKKKELRSHGGTGIHELPNSQIEAGKGNVGAGEKPPSADNFFRLARKWENAFKVIDDNFVTIEDGTGIVHIAPAFGEEDYRIGIQRDLPFLQHVAIDGRFTAELGPLFADMEVKPGSDDDKVRLSADITIIRYLKDHKLFFDKQSVIHSYPHCWRCDTPLLNYATSSWFVNVTTVKDKAVKLAKKINWSPTHIKEGRFGKWLEGARDWSISRQRYWASVMPVWQCHACSKYEVFGSVAALELRSGQTVVDLHKHIVDAITFPCPCGGDMKRLPDVLDTWFDSGSMPYAQVHYPFDNKEKFERSFPAEFIAEGQDQTRAWFYYVHILATALFGSIGYKNVIVNGIVLAEDGKKMSKKLQNYPDPNEVLEKYGADALRYYLLSSPVMAAESLNFSEAGVRETFNKAVNTLANVLEFYLLFAQERSDVSEKKGVVGRHKKTAHVLDRWITVKLQVLIKEVTAAMERYALPEASRPIGDFILELSQWYVRRSRDRFKGDDAEDKQAALATLHEVLLTLSKVMAPFTPFIAEKIYQEIRKNKVKGEDSVHLESWPEYREEHHYQETLDQMAAVRKIVEFGLSLRAEHKLKVRQPLRRLVINNEQLSKELQAIIADELNVKMVEFAEAVPDATGWATNENEGVKVWLDTNLDENLKKEGAAREIVRAINQLRKEQGLSINDRVSVVYRTADIWLDSVMTEFGDQIACNTLSSSIVAGDLDAAAGQVEIEGKNLIFGLKP